MSQTTVIEVGEHSLFPWRLPVPDGGGAPAHQAPGATESEPTLGQPLLLAIAVLAVAWRLGPTLAHGTLRGILEYDDGVHLSAAIHLLAGKIPYRSFTFVQPPGIVVLMTPLAALARLIGEPDAMALARVAMAAVGALNALLCARCAAPWGRRAALAAGIFYAVWPAAVVSERTVLLEPIVSALLLGALLLVRRGSPGTTRVAGVLLGVAVTVKLVALPLVLVVIVWLGLRRLWRPLLELVRAGLLTVVVITAPFVLAAPAAFWRMAIIDQVGRTHNGASVLSRLGAFDGNIFNLTTQHGIGPVIALGCIATFALATFGAGRQTLGAALWMALFVVALTEMLVAPDFYYHYGALMAGPAAVLAGLACARVSSWHELGAAKVVLACSAVEVIGFAAASWTIGRNVSVPTGSMETFLAAHPCAWADSSVLVAGDDVLASIRHHCATPVDGFGVSLDVAHGKADGSTLAQTTMATSLLAANSAVLQGAPAAQGWSVATVHAFVHRFVPVGHDGPFGLWVAVSR